MRGCIALVTGVSVTLQANWLTGLGRDHLAPALGSALPASLAGGASAIAGSKYAILQALAATASLALGATAPVLAAWLWYRLPGREVWDYWQATEIHAFLRGDGAFAEVRKVAVTLLVTATLVFVFVALWTAFRGYPQALGDAADAWVGLQKYYQRYVQRFDPSWFWLRVWGLLEALIRPSGSG